MSSLQKQKSINETNTKPITAVLHENVKVFINIINITFLSKTVNASLFTFNYVSPLTIHKQTSQW